MARAGIWSKLSFTTLSQRLGRTFNGPNMASETGKANRHAGAWKRSGFWLALARGWNTVIVIAVPTPLEAKTLQDLVAAARANPGKLNWAGTTGAIDFLFAGFLKKNKLDMARVPYRNPQDAANDVATERVQ